MIYGGGRGYILGVMITFMSAMLHPLPSLPHPLSTQGCCRLLMSLSVYHYLWMKRRRKRGDGESDGDERKVWMLRLHPLNYISSKIGGVGSSACHRRGLAGVSSRASLSSFRYTSMSLLMDPTLERPNGPAPGRRKCEGILEEECKHGSPIDG